MKTRGYLAALAISFFASGALAQSTVASSNTSAATDTTTEPKKADTKAAAKAMLVQQVQIQHWRPTDARGINVFETPKADGVAFTGFKLQFGGAFTQQFQGLDHGNTAAAKNATTTTGTAYNANQLMRVGHGFNNATANLYVNAQLARGIRVAMTSYLSSRHHQETWVKDGYLQIDASPIDFRPLERLMEFVTVKAGHFEINYGDAHFRRTDNGNSMYNPFVGNYLLDAFTTEVGGEVYVRSGPFLSMVGVTNGEVKGATTTPQARAPSFLYKAGFDQQLTPKVRARLTGTMYRTSKSANNTLHSGDRGGSRYYSVLENTVATEKDQAWSGAIQPGFGSRVTAIVINPFVKVGGLEVFGNLEQLRGAHSAEKQASSADRGFRQTVVEGLYRFAGEQLYVGGRWNEAEGNLRGITAKVGAKRSQVGGGWYITPTILTKVEYVTQTYSGFPTTDIRNGGQFKGFVIEGAVAF